MGWHHVVMNLLGWQRAIRCCHGVGVAHGHLCVIQSELLCSFFGSLWNNPVHLVWVRDIQLAPLDQFLKVIALVQSTS